MAPPLAYAGDDENRYANDVADDAAFRMSSVNTLLVVLLPTSLSDGAIWKDEQYTR